MFLCVTLLIKISAKIYKILAKQIVFIICIHHTLKMYLIKVKGVAKIPDYIQLRDDKFTLLAYFRIDRPEKALEKCGFADQAEYIYSVANSLPFGVIKKLEMPI